MEDSVPSSGSPSERLQRRRRRAASVGALPAPLGSFVGRGAELARLKDALTGEARLVTVTGPGGIGKTRLAIEAARRLARDGESVVMCDLSETFSRIELASAVAEALGVGSGPVSERALAEHVERTLAREGRCIVVLDNFEQLTAHAAVLVGWLTAAPDAVFLVTSRERLGVRGEQVVDLLPLGHVGAGIDGDPRECDAVRLLAERGRAASSRFELRDPDLPAAAAIVRALDGIPLAIELCAARLGVLGLGELRAQLEHGVLGVGVAARGSAPRHATLHATIDWSWRLLEPDARVTLQRCALFHGGFTLDAVRSVLELPEGARGTAQALERVQALHDRSLLRGVGERRFALYESVREFALARLEASGDRERAGDLYAATVLAIGARLAKAADGPDGALAREGLAHEAANLWAVVHDARRTPDEVLAALLALEALASERGPLDPYAAALDDAIARAPAGERRGRAVLLRGRIDVTRGAFDRALEHFARAKEEAHALGHRALEALATSKLAVSGSFCDRDMSATFAEAEALVASVGDPWLEGIFVSDRASARSRAGHEIDALTDRERTVTCFTRAGDARRRAVALGFLGSSCLATGQIADAERTTREAAQALRAFGDLRTEGQVTGFLARARHERGAITDARATYASSLDALVCVGERWFEGVINGWRGDLELDDDRFAESIAYYTRAIELLEIARERPYATLFRAARDVARVSDDAAALTSPIDTSDLPRTVATAIAIHEAHVRVLRGASDVAAALLRASETRGISDDVRFAERLLRRTLERLGRVVDDDGHGDGLEVGPEARWFLRRGNARVDLERHGGLRLVLLRLVEARLATPGSAVPREELIAAGWPGERIRPTAATNRLNVSLSRMKRLGLRDLLRTRDDGVLLDPAVPCSCKKD